MKQKLYQTASSFGLSLSLRSAFAGKSLILFLFTFRCMTIPRDAPNPTLLLSLHANRCSTSHFSPRHSFFSFLIYWEFIANCSKCSSEGRRHTCLIKSAWRKHVCEDINDNKAAFEVANACLMFAVFWCLQCFEL